MYQLSHAWYWIDSSQGTQDSDDSDCRHIACSNDLTDPAHNNNSKVKLHSQILLARITYYIPSISHIGVWFKQESEGYDFQNHLNRENDLEYKICIHLVLVGRRIWVIHGQKHTVSKNCQQDKSIKPSIEYHIFRNPYGCKTILMTLSLKGFVTVKQNRETVA